MQAVLIANIVCIGSLIVTTVVAAVMWLRAEKKLSKLGLSKVFVRKESK